MRSAGSNSGMTISATWRIRLATRCRSTAPPTDLATIKPICASADCPPWRRAYTTRSDCAARTPFFTVRPNSADRLIRFRAGSTARDLDVRQSENRGPYGGGRRRWHGRPGCAYAAGNREPWPDAGYSAGRSACPWPRLCLLVMCGAPHPVESAYRTSPGSENAPCLNSARTGAGPVTGRCRAA